MNHDESCPTPGYIGTSVKSGDGCRGPRCIKAGVTIFPGGV